MTVVDGFTKMVQFIAHLMTVEEELLMKFLGPESIMSDKKTKFIGHSRSIPFIKHGIYSFNPYIVDLFNHYLCFGFPQAWSQPFIHPIFKLRANSNLNNYRTIVIGHTLPKLYATILHL